MMEKCQVLNLVPLMVGGVFLLRQRCFGGASTQLATEQASGTVIYIRPNSFT